MLAGVAAGDVGTTLAVVVSDPEVVPGVLDGLGEELVDVDVEDTELDETELLDAEVVAAAAMTVKFASPTRLDIAPTAWTMCAPTAISAVTGKVIVTTPFGLARIPGTSTGAENTVTATASPGVKPLKTTVC